MILSVTLDQDNIPQSGEKGLALFQPQGLNIVYPRQKCLPSDKAV